MEKPMEQFDAALTRRRYLRALMVISITLLAGWLRFHAADVTPGEWDEDDYMAPAGEMYKALHGGEQKIQDVELTYEHPTLIKLMYALTIDGDEIDQFPTTLVRGERAHVPENSLKHARWQSAIAGTLTVLALAIFSPLAGLLLAVQVMHLHYTSVAYLEALPVLFTTLCGIFYQLPWRWTFWASAVCFGVAVAGKYPYAILGVLLLMHALYMRQHQIYKLVAWGLLALAVFFVLNPYLWPDPLGRLEKQLSYHQDYASDHESQPLKPLDQLINPYYFMHDTDEEYITPRILEVVMFFLALGGLPLLFRAKSVWGWWLLGGIVFLMVWPTQWVQHNMVIIVPYVISAATAINWIRGQVRQRLMSNSPSPAPASAARSR